MRTRARTLTLSQTRFGPRTCRSILIEKCHMPGAYVQVRKRARARSLALSPTIRMRISAQSARQKIFVACRPTPRPPASCESAHLPLDGSAAGRSTFSLRTYSRRWPQSQQHRGAHLHVLSVNPTP